MKKVIFVAALLFVLSIPVQVCASASESAQILGDFQKIRKAVDFVADSFLASETMLNDLRISPEFKSEACVVVPFEIGFISSEAELSRLMESILSYSQKDALLLQKGIYISVSAESLKSGQLSLSCVSGLELVYNFTGSSESLSASNAILLNAIKAILKEATFQPQIRKSIDADSKKSKTVNETIWMTNFRIDNDLRFQLSGYSFLPKMITEFADKLIKAGISGVFISNMNKNTFEKVPVWRFDLTGSLK
ncbi:MAG: hypothetical protein HQM10_10830 [Candidatus Riflebacteria bacterium]|nr:hypothetical protein [Candidatus Riflebacteria bacterium]